MKKTEKQSTLAITNNLHYKLLRYAFPRMSVGTK